MVLTNCTISGNQSGTLGRGGGLFNFGQMQLSGCTVSGNSAASGAGLYQNNLSTATLTNCTISGNSAFGGRGGGPFGAGGGGIFNRDGTTTLTNCTISGNFCSGNGGGVYNLGGSTTLTNCTVSGNSVGNYGGGLYNKRGTVALTNCTVSGNSCTFNGSPSGFGGGLYNASLRSMTLANTIVAGNSAASAPDVYSSVAVGAAFHSLGNNLIGKTDGSKGWVGSDLTGTIAAPRDPRLGPLANNGGPTLTMALLPGSPAIDAGNNALIPPGVTTDQRGFPLHKPQPDIGAFQTQTGLEAPAANGPPAPGGPFAVPVLNRLVLHRTRQRGSRSQVLGTTLVFNVPVNVSRRALSLVRHGRGKRTQNLSPWVQILMLVQDGQTFVRLRFRSPHNGGRLPQGRYSLFIRDGLVRNTLTDAPLAGWGGVTRLASWHHP